MRDDSYFMNMTLQLAKKGLGSTSPNPLVGAVIVKHGKVIATGYHRKAGCDHAEIAALKKAGKAARGAILYVNLEPCNHFGRTPPCTEVIIKSGIREVVAAMKDPNPCNNGKGVHALRRAGIAVSTGVLEGQARRLNEAFIRYICSKRPFITVKTAQSMDGKIATKTGDSKWISNEISRRYVHTLRNQVDAVMVGAGTAIKDNPLLTSRAQNNRPRMKQPIKVVVDSQLKTHSNARIFCKNSPAQVIFAATKKAPKTKIHKFEKVCREVLILKQKDNKVDLRHLMKELGKRQVTSVLVEGGGELIGSLVEERLVDKFLFFISPKIIGGKNAITAVEGKGVTTIAHATSLKDVSHKKLGTDLLIEGYPKE